MPDEITFTGKLRRLVVRGGEGSGHFGHEGRPGEVGGSQPSGRTEEHEATGGRKRLKATDVFLTSAGGKAWEVKYIRKSWNMTIMSLAREIAAGKYPRPTIWDITPENEAKYHLFHSWTGQLARIRDTIELMAQEAGVTDPEARRRMAEDFFNDALDKAIAKWETQREQLSYQARPGLFKPTDFISVPATERWAAVAGVMRDIDNVLQVPDLRGRIGNPTTDGKVKVTPSGAGGLFQTMGPFIQGIKVNPDIPEAPEIMAHEFGHLVDDIVLGDGNYASRGDDQAMKDLFVAVNASQGAQYLRDYGMGTKDVTDRNGFSYKVRYSLKDLRQQASSVEVFARGFAQWAALRTGNQDLRNAIDLRLESQTRGFMPGQWQWNDFEPIASGYDAIFDEKGLRKK